MTEQSYCQGLLHGFSKDCYMYKKGKLKSSDSTSPILWLELINSYHPWFVAITKQKEPIYSIGSFGIVQKDYSSSTISRSLKNPFRFIMMGTFIRSEPSSLAKSTLTQSNL